MRFHEILLASALLSLAAAPAAAGSLQFWEASRGAEGVTAYFPAGSGLQAYIYFDAASAETGGLAWGASEIKIVFSDSIHYVSFTCDLAGCNNSDWNFHAPDTQDPQEWLKVSDPGIDEEHGIYHLGTVTFDGPQEPGSMPLVECNYTTLDYHERTCSPFVLVTLPEPASGALGAGAFLLLALRRRRQTR
jgi:MYXO-CTERM domain-containing protein